MSFRIYQSGRNYQSNAATGRFHEFLFEIQRKSAAKGIGCQSLAPGLDSTYSSLENHDGTDSEDWWLKSPDGESNLGLLIDPEEQQSSQGMIDSSDTGASIFAAEQNPNDSDSTLFNDDSLIADSDLFRSNDLVSV